MCPDSPQTNDRTGPTGSPLDAGPSAGEASSPAASSDGHPQPVEGASPPPAAKPRAAGPAPPPGPQTAPHTGSPSPPKAGAHPPAAPPDTSKADPSPESTEDAVLAALAGAAPSAEPVRHEQDAGVAPLLARAVELGGSDLHLKPMRPPLVRLHGKLVAMEGEPLVPESLEPMLRAILNERQSTQLAQNLQVDFGYSVSGLSRFRATVFYQRSTLAAVFRTIPFEFPTIDDWGLPPVLKELCKLQRGLILVTGPTGAGKSSTLAAMIREIADTREDHIVSIEDPIEFLIRDAKSAVTQREVGTDCLSFEMGLRNALRQDPDVIMVGEMRDKDTVRTVLTAAETGHLVLSTLHTNSAAQTLDRILDHFSGPAQKQVRMQLAHSLEAIVSMQLVERADGEGLTAAIEVLRMSPQIRKLLEAGGVSEIPTEMEKSVVLQKMQSMNQSLVALVLTGMITREVAEAHSHNPGDFDLMLRNHLSEGEDKDDEMFPYSDYSNIAELDELRKLRNDAESRNKDVELEMQRVVGALKEQMKEKEEELQKLRSTLSRGKEEYDKLKDQLAGLKMDYETRIKKLQHRMREMSRANAQNR